MLHIVIFILVVFFAYEKIDLAQNQTGEIVKIHLTTDLMDIDSNLFVDIRNFTGYMTKVILIWLIIEIIEVSRN